MTDNAENILLEHLSYIRSKVDQTADDMSELKHRISSLESAIVSLQHEIAHNREETDTTPYLL
jgi:chromosome segregation ATPase